MIEHRQSSDVGSGYLRSCEALEEIARSLDHELRTLGHEDEPLEVTRRLRTEPFRVLVLGEFSRGKSTFINAVVGEKVLPSSVRPTTAVISVVKSGPVRSATVHWRDPARAATDVQLPEERASKALDQVVTAKNSGASEISKVQITLPLPHLGVPVEIIDTPGVNDIDTAREEVTYQYLAKADAAILLLDVQQPLSASEKRFLTERILFNDIGKLLFVVNKVDQVPEDKRQRALDFVLARLGEVPSLGQPIVCPVASKPAMRARKEGDERMLAESLFPAFERVLLRFLEEASGAGRIATARDRLSRMLQGAIDQRTRLLDSLQGEQAEIEEGIAAAQRRTRLLAAKLSKARSSVDGATMRFQHQSRAGVTTRLQQCRAGAEAIIEGSSFPCDEDLGRLRTVINESMRDIVSFPSESAGRITAELMEEERASTQKIAVVEQQDALTLHAMEQSAGARDPQSATAAAVVAAAMGGALLGPLGAIPAAIFGNWLAGKLAADRIAPQVRAQISRTLADVEHRSDGAIRDVGVQLRHRLEEGVVKPCEDECRRERETEEELVTALRANSTDRAARRRERSDELERLVALKHRLMAES